MTDNGRDHGWPLVRDALPRDSFQMQRLRLGVTNDRHHLELHQVSLLRDRELPLCYI